MDPLQFGLFFAALLIGYLLLHWRLAKYERYLKQMAGLQQINERLKTVADAVESIKDDRLGEALDQLHEDGGEILDGVRALERRAAHPVDRVVEVRGQGDIHATAGERICAAIEERMFQMGYRKLIILTDLTGVKLDDEVSIQVECERNMMPCKGSIVTRNGSIVAVDVQTVSKMFP